MFLGLAISQPLTIVDANFDALLFGGALIAISHLIVCQYVAALELTPQVPIVVDAATSPKNYPQLTIIIAIATFILAALRFIFYYIAK
jgi:hypothetical protein